MGEPTTTNTTATTVDAIIAAGESSIVTVAENLIIADMPWMGFPIWKQIWETILGWFATYLSKAAQTGATFAIIDIQVGGEETQMSAALAALVAAEKTGDPNAIQLAVKNYQLAQSALVHDDGSATPQ
jgi:hypothetical protein